MACPLKQLKEIIETLQAATHGGRSVCRGVSSPPGERGGRTPPPTPAPKSTEAQIFDHMYGSFEE